MTWATEIPRVAKVPCVGSERDLETVGKERKSYPNRNRGKDGMEHRSWAELRAISREKDSLRIRWTVPHITKFGWFKRQS